MLVKCLDVVCEKWSQGGHVGGIYVVCNEHPTTQDSIQPNAIFNVFAELGAPIAKDSQRCFTIRQRQHDKLADGLFRAMLDLIGSTSRLSTRTLDRFLRQGLIQA